jgi:AraC-like DNA-binding protein
VRAYAQRTVYADDLSLVESVPAQLEPVLNFEFGTMPGIHHREGQITARIALGGAQTSFSGSLQLWPGVASFAIFFQPAGWSQLFKVPTRELTNHFYDATAVMGTWVKELWNHMGEVATFEGRVKIVEAFLSTFVPKAMPQNTVAAVTAYLFHRHGAVRIPKLCHRDFLSLRQLERQFLREIGASPKTFARIARFQSALDAKLASPRRTWLDIAHSFGYYDQMHMIHDFEQLSRLAPNRLIGEMGEVRPPALVASI